VDLKKSQHNRPHEFVKYLSKEHDITVLSINDWWKEDQLDLKTHEVQFDEYLTDVDYRYITQKRITPILQEFLFKKSVTLLAKEDFDVHLNYNTLISGYEAAKSLPTIFDIADDLIAMIRNSPQIPPIFQEMGGLLGKYYLKKNIEMAKKVTITTPILKFNSNIPVEKAIIVPNGVDTERFRNLGDTKIKLGLEGFIIGYVGVLREWVDFKPVFKALTNLPLEVKMLIVGREGALNEVKSMAKNFGVRDRVIFTGAIPYNDVPEYISAMDVCLIPFKESAISEGALPLKLFEYLSCEKPVISTRLQGVIDTVGDRVFYADSTEEYVIQINSILNGDFAINKNHNARQEIIKNYSWERITQNLNHILLDVIS
jgi:glycosyltransferase involved in cell wall biosynthesis